MRTCALVVSVLFAVGCGDPTMTEEEVVEVEEISDGLGTWAKIGTLPSNLYGTSLTGMHYAHGKFWIGSDDLVMEGKPSIYGGWSWRAALNAEYRVVGVGSSNTGVVAGVAYETIRRKHFEFFYYVHHIAWVALIFAAIHSHTVGGRLMQYLSVGAFFYAIDRIMRFYRSV